MPEFRCPTIKILTPKARPRASASSTLRSFELATSFITLVILATLLVARMRSLTAYTGYRMSLRTKHGSRSCTASHKRWLAAVYLPAQLTRRQVNGISRRHQGERTRCLRAAQGLGKAPGRRQGPARNWMHLSRPMQQQREERHDSTRRSRGRLQTPPTLGEMKENRSGLPASPRRRDGQNACSKFRQRTVHNMCTATALKWELPYLGLR